MLSGRASLCLLLLSLASAAGKSREDAFPSGYHERHGLTKDAKLIEHGYRKGELLRQRRVEESVALTSTPLRLSEVLKEGTGALPRTGQSVTVHCTG